MSHYQHQYYAQAAPTNPNPAPISSFYAARQRFEQASQLNAAPPHLRQNAYEYKQHTAPPKHPAQHARTAGHQSIHLAREPSKVQHHHQAHAQTQVQGQQYARPQSQYGQIQPYEPPYAQSQPQGQVQAQTQPAYRAQTSAPRPSSLYGMNLQSGFNPMQNVQSLYGYSTMSVPVPQIRGGPTPAQAFALYEAYNARQQQRAAAVPSQPQSQVLPQPQQAQEYAPLAQQPSQQNFQPQSQPQQARLQQQYQYQQPQWQQQQPAQGTSSSMAPQSQFGRPIGAQQVVTRAASIPFSQSQLQTQSQFLENRSAAVTREGQFGYPSSTQQAAPSINSIPVPVPQPPVPRPQPQQPAENRPTVGSRRPLPQPGQGRARPLSMPSQTQIQDRASATQPSRVGHGHSSSVSNTSQPSAGPSLSTSSQQPSPSHIPTTSLKSAFTPTASDVSGTAHTLPKQDQTPEKVPLDQDVSAQKTPTQRRVLPQSPTAPPDLSQLKQRRSTIGSSPIRSQPSRASTLPPALSMTTEASGPPPFLLSDSEVDGDRLSVASRESKGTSQRTPSPPSPQYGILDLPKRNSHPPDAKTDPPSPQYGIKDLPMRTKSIVDRRKAWERAEQGMNEAVVRVRSKSTAPTKSSVPPPGQSKSAPITPSRSPQPQTPQQQQKLPMPVVRQPQPSRTERTPSWTLPNADLENIAPATANSKSNVGEKKTSMAMRLAQMTLDEEKASANRAKSQVLTTPRQVQAMCPDASSSNSTPSGSPTKSYPFSTRTPRRSANIDINLDDPPPPSLRRTPSPTASTASSSVPSIPTIKTPDDVPQITAPTIPKINLPGGFDDDDDDDVHSVPEVKVQVPAIVVSRKPSSPQKANVPVINLPGDDGEDSSGPTILVSAPTKTKSDAVSMPAILDDLANTAKARGLPRPPSGATSSGLTNSKSGSNLRSRGGGLVCGGCRKGIIGRIVSAMGLRWHPQCFRCCQCGEQLEHVSSYEHDGKPYCHLDYHELFAPQCYSCKTPIIDERFITLDDPALGKRTYHEQHFFCAECGDPFLAPAPAKSASKRSGPNEINIKGDGAFDVAVDEDGLEVGFTVFKGHPYCEACHVRLRAPKCKACKKSIRDGMRAVEALGGKWCYECFVCTSCQKPFEEPSFFQRDKKPFCELCFSIILRNEI